MLVDLRWQHDDVTQRVAMTAHGLDGGEAAERADDRAQAADQIIDPADAVCRVMQGEVGEELIPPHLLAGGPEQGPGDVPLMVGQGQRFAGRVGERAGLLADRPSVRARDAGLRIGAGVGPKRRSDARMRARISRGGAVLTM